MISWLRKHLPNKKTIKKQAPRLAKFLNISELWAMNRKSVARGLGLGLFAAFIPLPIQTVLAVLLCCIFRGNLPVALLATMVSNPITFVPITIFIIHVGNVVISNHAQNVPLQDLQLHINWNKFCESISVWIDKVGEPFLVGVPIVAVSVGVLGFLLVQIIWVLVASEERLTKVFKKKN